MDIPQLLFSFSGRMNRRPYWLVPIGIGLTGGAMSALVGSVLPETVAILVILGVSIAMLWISVALGVKRAHDRGRSGLFLLLALIPLVNLWPMVELAFLPGTSGENKFGPDPLG